jgi:hypothetical protein
MSNIQRSQPRLCPCPSMSVRVRPCPSVSVRVRPCPSMRRETGNQTTLGCQAISTSHDLPNCCLYLEGQFATNAGPIPSWPSAGQCLSNGFFVGSMSVAGDYPCRGQMQYLETFDYPRAPTQIPESSPRHPKNLPRGSTQSRNAPKKLSDAYIRKSNISRFNAKPQCPKDARTITNDKSQFPMDSPAQRRRVRGEKRKNDCLLCALSGSLREMRAWGFWFRLTNITGSVLHNGDTIQLWNTSNYVSHTYSSHPLKPTVPPAIFTPASHRQTGGHTRKSAVAPFCATAGRRPTIPFPTPADSPCRGRST